MRNFLFFRGTVRDQEKFTIRIPNLQIRTAMMLGLVFVETVVIYALIVAILIIFVL